MQGTYRAEHYWLRPLSTAGVFFRKLRECPEKQRFRKAGISVPPVREPPLFLLHRSGAPRAPRGSWPHPLDLPPFNGTTLRESTLTADAAATLTSALAWASADRLASAWQTHWPLGSCACWLSSSGRPSGCAMHSEGITNGLGAYAHLIMRQSMRCPRKTSKSRGKAGLSGPENKRVFR